MDSEATQALDRPRFCRSWRAIGATQDRAFDEFCHRYAEAHRAYHNQEHIAECLAWLDRMAHLAERADEIAIALYFHDAVYDPAASDNEASSAELFRELARDIGIDAAVVARVTALIESTATHEASLGDAALLSDIDLATLGASPARYARYEASVRREYSAFPDELYRAGRARVLRMFLERIAIYRTPEMAALLEAQARNNLSHALAALEK